MIAVTEEKTTRRTVRVDLSQPIFKKTKAERKEIREQILLERKEAFNVLAEY